MKLGTETGSVINHILASVSQSAACVGDAATVLQWSDRRPGTVVAVTRCTITVQEDDARRVDGLGMSDCQEWEYSRNPSGPVSVFRRRKDGSYRDNCGRGLLIGRREKYHDFSF